MKTAQKITPLSKQFGERLKEIRLKNGYHSLEAFAFKNDISRVLYSNWEHGRGNITLKNLEKVTKALNVSLKEFFSHGFD
jgi:transcriptional regulator with XRE-family HTH domain